MFFQVGVRAELEIQLLGVEVSAHGRAVFRVEFRHSWRAGALEQASFGLGRVEAGV